MRSIKIQQSITRRNDDSLSRYFHDIDRKDLLSIEEEVILAKKIRSGDQAALDKLVSANLRFVVSVAKKYTGQGLSLSDLISEGNIGLIEAARRFDETKGFKFISYAVWWIRQSIMMAISGYERLVRLPMNQITGIIALNNHKTDLEQHLQREPTVSELAVQMDLSEEKIKMLMEIMPHVRSLDKVANDETGATLVDVLPDHNMETTDDQINRTSLHQDIDLLLGGLGKREKVIVECFFGLRTGTGIDLESIALKIGLSKERTRQLKYKALKHMSELPGTKRLKEYL